MNDTRTTIGRNALLNISNMINIPMKVDTGADSSSLWASDIQLQDGHLSFVLFDPSSSFYTGERITPEEFTTTEVASSNGGTKKRYVVYLPAMVNGMALPKVRFTLADRSAMTYPALLGRTTLDGVFVVDVSHQISDEYDTKLVKEKAQRLAKKSATLVKGN